MSAAIPSIAPDALAGRVVLVVGALGGLGSEVARACARAGAEVVLLGRRVPRLNRLYDEIVKAGGKAAIYPLDLEGATPADYDEMAAKIEAEFGRLDGIVHAAANFPGLTPLELAEPEAMARTLHVNLTAPMLLTQACLPLMKKSADAAVVFVGDDCERIGRAHWGAYAVSKHALRGTVAVWDDELVNTSVRVSLLEPGPMRTSLRGRAYFGANPAQWPEAAAYAPAVLHLLSPDGVEHRGRAWAPRVEAG